MLDEKPIDGSALVTGKATKPGSSSASSKPNREGRWCSYCKKSGHTKENCFKLHGKDKALNRIGGFEGIQLSQANQTTLDSASDTLKIEEDVPNLSKAELEHL